MKFVTEEVNKSYIEVKHTDKEGILQYAYCLFDYGIMPAPASTAVHIAFIIDGIGHYNGMKIKTGDVLAYGINKEPMISRVENVAVFIVSIEFWLFYQMTGITPAACQDIILFKEEDSIYKLGNKLFTHSPEKWMYIVEDYINEIQDSGKYKFTNQMTRVFNVANLCHIQNQKSFKEIASDLNISYRQLQRDFNTILGITLKEYESIARFHKAVNHLEEKNIVQSAVEAGYWDQSHMIREFKRMCGYTPTYIKKNQTNGV
ncbi:MULTISPECIES: helix-turn-helix domain-containing protein [Clostridium]|uniref:helix-turn-helix domain-containing protein n=1 Tax=Clostridium TaxID=1485 RepID=UPI000983B381|nr:MULTISPECIES: AraC family transcriptional regulator [Clostridium]AQR95962.1 transcriptional activator FtrA [Clostridium saccharoperbutylacetonicum]NSB31829.1 AraC-like DNA-binding protein [Clostridium saccharoperbutylacetonicum]